MTATVIVLGASTAARRTGPAAWAVAGTSWWIWAALAAALVVVTVCRRRVRNWLTWTAVTVVTLTAVAMLGHGLGWDRWLQRPDATPQHEAAEQRAAATEQNLRRVAAERDRAEQRRAAAEQDVRRLGAELEAIRAEARRIAEMHEASQAAAEAAARAAGAEAAAVHTEPTAADRFPAAGRTHPEVQQQARAVIENVVAFHEQRWPWMQEAHASADFVFYDSTADLPCNSDRAIGCVATGLPRPAIALALDVVRWDSLDEIVVHELAHIWTQTTDAGRDMAAAFAVHYVGCRAHGLDSERLADELLADAVVMLVLEVGYMAPTRGLDPYGYYDTGFKGCLVDQQPSEELWGLLLVHLSDPVWGSGD